MVESNKPKYQYRTNPFITYADLHPDELCIPNTEPILTYDVNNKAKLDWNGAVKLWKKSKGITEFQAIRKNTPEYEEVMIIYKQINKS